MTKDLRIIKLRYDASGKLVEVADAKLYKGAFGYHYIEVYIPFTPNDTKKSLVKMGRIVEDAFGKKTFHPKDTYGMVCLGSTVIDEIEYYIYRAPVPSTFLEQDGALTFLFNYMDLVDTKDPNGDPITIGVSRLMLEPFTTNVEYSDIITDDIVIDPNAALEAQVNANTIAIELFEDWLTLIDDDLQSYKKQVKTAMQQLEVVLKSYTDDGISEHNNNKTSHPFILQLIQDAVTALQTTIKDEVDKHNKDNTSHTFILQWLQRLQDLINAGGGGGGGVKIPPYRTYIDGTQDHQWTLINRQYEFVIEHTTHALGTNVWVEFKDNNDKIIFIEHNINADGDIYILSDIDAPIYINVVQM